MGTQNPKPKVPRTSRTRSTELIRRMMATMWAHLGNYCRQLQVLPSPSAISCSRTPRSSPKARPKPRPPRSRLTSSMALTLQTVIRSYLQARQMSNSKCNLLALQMHTILKSLRLTSDQVGWISEVFASENSISAKLFFNAKDLVVFGQSVWSAGCSTLNLTSSKTADKVGDKVVFCLSTSVGNHNTPSCLLRHVWCLDWLSDTSNLVDFKEQSITKLLLNTSLNALRISDQKIVTNNLNATAHSVRHFNVGVKVILVKWIFNGLNWILLSKVIVKIQ